jgi:ankyrin repeat protein
VAYSQGMAGKEKKPEVNVYAIAREAGTASLEAFLATKPEQDDLGTLLESYSQDGRADAMAVILRQPMLAKQSLEYALRCASGLGHTEVVRQLLALENAPPGPDARKNASPLCEAALGKHTDCARLLLDAGADPNRAPEAWPASTEDVPMRGDGPTPLLNAIRAGDAVLVRELIKRGADLGRMTLKNRRPLDVAVRKRSPQCSRRRVQNASRPMSSSVMVDRFSNGDRSNDGDADPKDTSLGEKHRVVGTARGEGGPRLQRSPELTRLCS